MALIDRVKNILITPKTEWDVIAGETTTTSNLLTGYVAPLAAIPAICGFIGASLIGYGMFGVSYKVPIVFGLSSAVFHFLMSFVTVLLVAVIVNMLAPSFSGEKNDSQAMKLTVYSFTAAWVGGVFAMIPGFRWVTALCALYGVVLLYFGLPKLMKCPEDKAIGYAAVILIIAIVVSLVISMVAGLIAGIGGMASGMIGGSGFGDRMHSSSNVTIDKNSNLGKLEAFGKKMEEAGKKMEAAEKSGNKDEAAKAAMGMFGAVLGGGKSVEPLGIEQLKPFVPESFAGLAKKSSKAEKTGAMGIMVSKAEARYGDDSGKNVHLEVSDTGGASGMMMFAGWAMVQGEKEDEYGSEKTGKVGGRLVHEKVRKDGRNEYDVVIGERFVVSAKGKGVDLNTLKGAVSGLDLGKLEGMKDVGVQK
jgi:hypothetical protein